MRDRHALTIAVTQLRAYAAMRAAVARAETTKLLAAEGIRDSEQKYLMATILLKLFPFSIN